MSRVHSWFISTSRRGVLVKSPEGKVLADLEGPRQESQVLPALRLTNKRGELRLERLEVAQWSGVPPRGDVELDKPRLHLADGTFATAKLPRTTPSTKTFRLAGASGSRLAADQIESAVLAPPSDEKPGPSQSPAAIRRC